jgi:hypothetical protein
MENLNNLPPFYVGQKVVYISGVNMPKYSRHIVLDIIKWPCGCWYIDVGQKVSNVAVNARCLEHDARMMVNNDVKYFLASSFRQEEKQTYPLIELKKVIEKEKVLLCSN